MAIASSLKTPVDPRSQPRWNMTIHTSKDHARSLNRLCELMIDLRYRHQERRKQKSTWISKSWTPSQRGGSFNQEYVYNAQRLAMGMLFLTLLLPPNFHTRRHCSSCIQELNWSLWHIVFPSLTFSVGPSH